MQIFTTIPPTRLIPDQARIDAIYAATLNPYTGAPQRVQVLAVRRIGISPEYNLIADVRASLASQGYSVALANLANFSAIVSQEVAQ